MHSNTNTPQLVRPIHNFVIMGLVEDHPVKLAVGGCCSCLSIPAIIMSMWMLPKHKVDSLRALLTVVWLLRRDDDVQLLAPLQLCSKTQLD